MADYPITAVDRRVVYSGSAGTGPYNFSFPVLTATDIDVYKDTTKLTLTTDYSVTISATDGTGSVTLGSAASGSNTVTIVGARAIQRTTDFVTAGDLLASSLNVELDSQTIFVQQASEDATRAIKAPVTDPTSIDMTLPAKASRKGKYLAFNTTTGDPEAGASSDDVTTLAAVTTDIATLADIEDGTVATDAIQTVAGISGNVSTVAGISSNVTTVAGISADVTTVAADGTDIGTVAGIAANVTTVAGISSDVTTVAADGTDIGTVAGISANVTTVAGISSDVTTVAGISGDVSSVAAQVVGYNFSTTTAMADPGSGNVRFNNATLASVTAIAIDDLDANGVDQSAYIALFDDSTNTVKGTLVFRTGGGDVATFNITGLTDNTGWFQIAVTHVASSGTFSNAEDTFIGFTRAGDKGADGAGSGDVSGPGASVTDNAVTRWDGTSGQLVQNSSVIVDDSGNVGIGTSPSYRLHISNGSSTGTAMQLQTTGSGHNFDMVDGTGTARFRNVNGEMRLYGDVNSGGNGNIIFAPQGTAERMRIDSSGNVGIGDSAATAMLDVAGDAAFGSVASSAITGAMVNIRQPMAYNPADGDGTSAINIITQTTITNGSKMGGISWARMTSNGGTTGASISGIGETTSAVGLAFGTGTNNTERMRIDSSGNVGIGISPSYDLDVTGDINFTGTLYQNGSAFSGGLSVYAAGEVVGGTTTISRGVWTDVTFTETADSGTTFNGTTFTVPAGEGGVYELIAWVEGDYNSIGNDGEAAGIRFDKNSGTILAEASFLNLDHSDRNQVINTSYMGSLAAGDTIVVEARFVDGNASGSATLRDAAVTIKKVA